MPSLLRKKTAIIPGLLLLAVGQAAALEVPLSRTSFERALREGRACESFHDMGPHVVARKSLEGVAQAIVNNAIESPDTSYSFVIVRLETPYTRVRWLACQANLLGRPLDEEDLWRTVQGSATVSLLVETEALHTKNELVPLDDRLKDGLAPDPVRTGGPRVQRVALRRGNDRHAVVVDPIPGDGVAYDFPAEALQGKGPFYAIIGTMTPPLERTLKLKRSALAEP